MNKNTKSHTSYIDRLVQLVPAEIVAAYLAVQGIVFNSSNQRETDLALEVSAGVLFLILPFYLWRLQGVRSVRRILLTMGSFVVWVYVVSTPVHSASYLVPLWGSIAMILWTTIIPVFRFEED